MINRKCISKEWIEEKSKALKADKILVEKVIRALILLEGLVESGLDFTFKGGTALMLMLENCRRLSIDIDIIVEDKALDLSAFANSIVQRKDFIRFEKQERKSNSKIDKEHYKLFFLSAIEEKEAYILLDVLKEKNHYQNIIDTPIKSIFTELSDEAICKVKTPDFNNLLGDKLTAFAPNTTGIPYKKGDREMGMEIIKQLYDIGILFDYFDNPVVVSSVFQSFATTEIAYREKQFSTLDVLNDINDNALEICLRGNYGKSDFGVLLRGINRVKGFIFFETFHLEKAITHAAKTVYIAALIRHG